MNKKLFSVCAAALALSLSANRLPAQNDTLDLAGNWEFQIDRTGEAAPKAQSGKPLSDRILLPGSMPQRLKGDNPTVETRWTASIYDSSYFYNPHMEKYRQADNFKLPFFLTPDRHYVGTAWYRKNINIPMEWAGQRITLFLERPHIETQVFLNGKPAGRANSLSTPHVFDLTGLARSGTNILAIRVDNRIESVCVGADSHSVTDQTQGNWNGIVGNIELQSSPLLYAEDIQVYPDIRQKKAIVRLRLNGQRTKGNPEAEIRLSACSFNSEIRHEVPVTSRKIKLKNGIAEVEMTLEMGDSMQLWDEFPPRSTASKPL